MANFRYSHLFTTRIGDAAIQAAAAKLNTAEIALAISDGEEKILFKNAEGEVVAVATEEQLASAITNVESSLLERISELNQFLNDEVERATSAETDLQTEITNLEASFEDRIDQLTQFLNEERERAERVEEQLQGADIASGAVSSELVVTVTQNNGNVITFSSPDIFELHAGEF
jgi:hypothetical protein